MDCDISRFEKMYEGYFDEVKAELTAGRKSSHWMWFIFPQIKGLGHSDMAVYFAIADLNEARAFLDAECGKKMLELIQILLGLQTNDAVSVFGSIDAVKLRSSMTLFALARPEITLFQEVLQKFYGGERDELTVKIVTEQQGNN